MTVQLTSCLTGLDLVSLVSLKSDSDLLVHKQSPGLVVMGRDSRSKGRGFDSRRRILDGHFSHLFVVKIVKFV